MVCLVSDGNKEFNLALPTAKRRFAYWPNNIFTNFDFIEDTNKEGT